MHYCICVQGLLRKCVVLGLDPVRQWYQYGVLYTSSDVLYTHSSMFRACFFVVFLSIDQRDQLRVRPRKSRPLKKQCHSARRKWVSLDLSGVNIGKQINFFVGDYNSLNPQMSLGPGSRPGSSGCWRAADPLSPCSPCPTSTRCRWPNQNTGSSD